MNFEFRVNYQITTEQFRNLLINSLLGKRRPIDDEICLGGMLKYSNLIVTAWQTENLIGIARSMTDFHYACYLSDLAVDKKYHKLGIGKKLQSITQEQLGPKCKIILVAAPDANEYYEHIGYTNNQRCWILARNENIKY